MTGAFMVLSVYNGQKHPDNSVSKIMTYSMIQDFNSKFIEKHEKTDCRDLLNCDMTTEAGLKFMQDNHLSEKVCEKCILSSVNIINELID